MEEIIQISSDYKGLVIKLMQAVMLVITV